MKNKGQADGLHLGLFILCILAIGGCIFLGIMLYNGKQTQNSVYQAESKPSVSQPNIHPLCGIIFDINGRDKDANPSKISH